MTDIASLGLRIDTSEVKDGVTDLGKLADAASKAERSAQSFEKTFDKATASVGGTGKAAEAASKKIADGIDKQVKALQDAVAVQGKSASQAKLYELAQAGASRAQLDSAASALKMRDAFVNSQAATERTVASLKKYALAAGVAAGAALAAVAVIANKAIEQAGSFKDLAEQTGATSAEIAALQIVAAKSGKSLDDVAGFSIKLTKALSKTDDESKLAGRGLAAIGLQFDEFKKKTPVEQLDALAVALQQFKDGPGKAAALEAIVKGGAQLIPFLNDLSEAQDRQTRLTVEQITVLDEFGKKQAENKDRVLALAQVILAESIPALNTLTDYLLKAATEAAGLNTAGEKLGGNTGIRNFAQDAAVAIASFVERCQTAVDAIGTVLRAAQQLGSGLRLAAEVAQLATPAGALQGLTSGDPLGGVKEAYAKNQEALAKLSKSFQATIDASKGSESKKLRELFDQQNRVGDDPEIKRLAARARAASESKLKDIDTRGLVTPGRSGGGKKDNSAAQEAKAQLASDLDAIRNAQEALLNTYSNAEKILEAKRSAALVDEQQYYGEKKRLLELSNAAQEEGLQKEIARLQQEKLSGKEAIDNAKKIADAQAKLAKVQENATTSAQVLGIQEAAAYKKIADSISEAKIAAQDYLDTTKQRFDREIAGFGKGDQARERDALTNATDDKFLQQRQTLAADLRRNQITKAQYDQELEIINDAHKRALALDDEYFKAKLAKQQDFTLGAKEALQNYYDESQNVFKQTQEAVTNAFKGMEDALLEFVTTGKLNFKSLVDSILKDILRIAIKQSITGPLANALNGQLGADGGSGGGLAGLFGSALSAFGGSAGLTSGANAMSGDALDNLLKLSNNFGGRAIGGPVRAGGLYAINEKGVGEVFNTRGGKQYFMPANDGTVKTTTSADARGGNVTINVPVTGQVDRRTRLQIAGDLAMEQRRSRRYA